MKPRYRKGERIDDPKLVVFLILQDKPLFWNHKVQNSTWMRNQQLRTIETEARRGAFYFAHPIRERIPA